ncbi:E3 ubiquitin ligase PARAQUAT TOLERANCE 3-like isoform X2 [Tasmannia lanceolata]|uniref:E3 ubiquitin ligase PARAQUAT TOLERANCE 3-like isoform X2 n=1 Tax=Tasmannia lanceolata TaxID=3420 RepID=UPI00406319C8
MAVYYKFKSAKDYDSVSIDGHFISVANLKEKIFESKHLGRGTDFDLMVSNAQTNEEMLPVQPVNPMQVAPPDRADEDNKLKALINTSALDWQGQTSEAFGSGRGFGRSVGGRMMAGHGFGRGGGWERKTPPQGYICYRCKVPGHFIQHCPTNGDPNYDVRRVKPPTGIPKSMLMATPDGSYALPSGAVAVLKPNEAAFEKEIEGLPSTRLVIDLPPEFCCPLCKEVMKDAVLTSKCCFKSFCDKCIRDHIISKSSCVCGATNILADDLLPNKTLRETISRLLESTTSSAERAGSFSQVQDMESALCPQPKAPSPTLSATAKEAHLSPSHKDDTPNLKQTSNEAKAVNAPQQSGENITTKNVNLFEAMRESMSFKEPKSQGSAPLADEEVQQSVPISEPEKKKKKKKARLPANATDLQWKTPQDLAAENYMMPFGPSSYNPYWGGVQWGLDGYMAPYSGAMPMGYPGPFDLPFGGGGPFDLPFGGGVLPQDPFGGQSYMMPFVPPQRDLSELAFGSNPAPPIMSREEFEARKANLRRKREIERRSERGSKDRDCSREVSSSADISSMKSKPRLISQAATVDRRERGMRLDHTGEGGSAWLPPFVDQRKSNYDDLAPEMKGDRKQKGNVFSRISFSEPGDGKKKRKPSEAPYLYEEHGHLAHKPLSNGHRDESKTVKAGSNGGEWKSAYKYESSDEDYHFKRRRPSSSRHDSVEREEDGRPSRGSREHARDHERVVKHR